MTMKLLNQYSGRTLALLPLLPPIILISTLLENPVSVLQRWYSKWTTIALDELPTEHAPSIASQLLTYIGMAILGYLTTDRLVPHIRQYTLLKGIKGKDLGKKGTKMADKDIPEALGIVPGAVFLVCLIFCLVWYAATHPSKLLDVNSALLSVCFMLFLGFTDDVLDWPWRYKLFLPSVASLPLLCCYKGSTSIVVPIQLRQFLWQNGSATTLGHLLSPFLVIDSQAHGSLIDLGYFYLLYMGMLAVFCTNAINIYAGINGLEAGQAYIIGCAVLVHNLIEIQHDQQFTNNVHVENSLADNHLFSCMIILIFVGVTLGLLKHNWYPATVFVGDTFCYFAGMTFAVVGILGHFSKTLLLFFIPQVVNFLWSTPQLFKFVPCPRHRLPFLNTATGLMEPSTFECQPNQYRMLKRTQRRPIDDTKCPNMTLICLMLQIMGPMSERSLCISLLLLQAVSCAFGLVCRYYIAQFFFDKN